MNKNEAFSILGLKQGATEADIKKAYRKLANQYHPDKNQGNKESEDTFKKVTSAYEFLTKPQTQNNQRPEDFFNNFHEFFSSGNFRFNYGGNRSDSRQGSTKVRRNVQPNPNQRVLRLDHVEISVQIDIESLLLRTPISINLKLECCCKDCLSNKEIWSPCQTCNQVGYTSVTTTTPIGLFTQEQICQVCHGNGWVSRSHCKTCKDKIIYFKEKVVNFTIPSDYKYGNKIRLSSAGREGWNCQAADLIINPRYVIPDYSTLSEEDKKSLTDLLGKK